ncbi:hypothetical protein DL237_13025 [Pseudooceanicola sediminis]|uniref:Chaperone modulatory protein CbpM n=1 Tax=Pseudooceanicola sediminis TaxID=2211117 RepID=A0A399J1C1_9RHOB|nr:chaperone modulator CbpM [Pseudooceanicola sediminis]KAA2313297.1 hypothetical protein E0K93_13840 [Puniceibacterium sp. HSS470]RII38417.1 hypothetical protein DL237_13025 [Pseudooceanicola sediminis]|tara:strand:- start:765 stop:1094 length:330 start_codon:yes stop_codon:yes gene_type:complete
MSTRFTEDEVIAAVTRLTRPQLIRYIEVAFVRPERAEQGYLFRQVDLARLELLCDLSQDLELDENALHVVIPLLDQLHAARLDLARLTDTLRALPPDLQDRIARYTAQR